MANNEIPITQEDASKALASFKLRNAVKLIAEAKDLYTKEASYHLKAAITLVNIELDKLKR